ncbi:16548_t:CDS:2 [Acaulospora morrowiae]|uniref:16548_t:CDS:1 n=1 Tax=Acaulospora morrowiae TaxID=94023 RepID=A0A9N9F880_9GLOM|nr:16548_t:CDS:2 [Acaulospora morrowiae]
MNKSNIEFSEGSSRKVKKSQPCHPVWQYLSWNADKTFIFCNLCLQRYSSKTRVSTLKGHFVTNHRETWEGIRQQTMLPINSLECDKMDAEKAAKLDYFLLRWIVCDQQPFSIVEEKEFYDLISTLNSQYKLLSHQMVSVKIQEMYEKQRKVLKAYLSNLDSKVAITTDIWNIYTDDSKVAFSTDIWTTYTYMSVMLHWIDCEWKMNHILIDLIPFLGDIELVDTIYTTINEFNLGEKIISITTDDTPNMDVFEQELTKMLYNNHDNTLFRHIRCPTHTLNLMAKNGLAEAERIVTKVREFAITIHSSQTIFEKLKNVFEMKGMLVSLLSPIHHAINFLSTASYPTFGDLHMVFLVIINVLHEALHEEHDTLRKRVADKMNEKLSKYWNGLKSTFREAVILDPNSKLSSFNPDTDKRDAQDIVYETFKMNYATKSNEPSPGSESLRAFFRNQLKRKHGMFMENNDTLEEYLCLPVEDVDVLSYWKIKSADSRWAPVACMARDYLAAQAISVPSDRIFCTTKFSINTMKDCLYLENARAALCLKTWIEMGCVEEEYLYEKDNEQRKHHRS